MVVIYFCSKFLQKALPFVKNLTGKWYVVELLRTLTKEEG